MRAVRAAVTAEQSAVARSGAGDGTGARTGARILGIHVEGPFLNPARRGAQSLEALRTGSVDEAVRWLAAAPAGWRWQVTLAPEAEGAAAVIRYLTGRGAVVAAGHTDCTYGQFAEAVRAGLAHAAHLFNGMRGLHHREPGPAGAALTLPGITAELVADGVHVHPAVLAMAVAARGPEGIILVTDAIRAAGMPDGAYRVGEHLAAVAGGEARLPDGTLAGSVLTMAAAVRNMMRFAGVPLHQAAAMASLNPARLHGIDALTGSIAPGKQADLVLLDQNLDVAATLMAGETVYDAR